MNLPKPLDILIIENSHCDIELLLKTFERSKFDCNSMVVTNSQDALKCLNKTGIYKDFKTPDIIILDIELPNESGLELLNKLKQLSQIKKIPIILLSSSDEEEIVNLAYHHHVACFIHKSNNKEQYIHKLNILIEFWSTTVTLIKKPF